MPKQFSFLIDNNNTSKQINNKVNNKEFKDIYNEPS